MESSLHDQLLEHLKSVENVFTESLNTNSPVKVSKQEYMNLYLASYRVTLNAQCAEVSLKSLKSWFRGFVRKCYKEHMKCSENLESEDHFLLYIDEHNRVLSNFRELRKFFERVFSTF